jgi:hypothetical protein
MKGFVYFAEAIGARAVKIGFCWRDCRIRIKNMQSSNHCDLRLVASIPNVKPQLEADLHKRFAHLHIRGEWFKLVADLKAFVRANKAAALVLPKAVEVRCFKCHWRGKWRRLEQCCPKCKYWCPMPIYW